MPCAEPNETQNHARTAAGPTSYPDNSRWASVLDGIEKPSGEPDQNDVIISFLHADGRKLQVTLHTFVGGEVIDARENRIPEVQDGFVTMVDELFDQAERATLTGLTRKYWAYDSSLSWSAGRPDDAGETLWHHGEFEESQQFVRDLDYHGPWAQIETTTALQAVLSEIGGVFARTVLLFDDLGAIHSKIAALVAH